MPTLKHVDFEVPDWRELAKVPTLWVSYTDRVLGMEPQGHWPCDDAVGSTSLRDLSGRSIGAGLSGNYTLGLSPGPIAWNTGSVIQGNDAVSGNFALAVVPSGSGLNTAGAVTLGGWVKTGGTILLGRLGSGPGFNYMCSVKSGDKVEIGHHDGTSTLSAEYAATVTDNLWHFVLGVRQDDGLTWSAYVDGELIGGFTAPNPTPGSDSTHRFISLSSAAWEGQGQMAHNMLLHRALSDDEIKILYDTGRGAMGLND